MLGSIRVTWNIIVPTCFQTRLMYNTLSLKFFFSSSSLDSIIMANVPPDKDDPMGDALEHTGLNRRGDETDPGGQSRKGKERQRRLEPTGSSRNTRYRSPSPGELEDVLRSSRHTAREDHNRRAGVGTSSSNTGTWRIDGEGIVLHTGTCVECKSYAMHVYDHDEDYFDPKERRDVNINSGVIARAN